MMFKMIAKLMKMKRIRIHKGSQFKQVDDRNKKIKDQWMQNKRMGKLNRKSVYFKK